jgi:hypothetical protein
MPNEQSETVTDMKDFKWEKTEKRAQEREDIE